MNKFIPSLALPVILLAIPSAGASEFAGSYFGLKAGGNRPIYNDSAASNNAFANLSGVETRNTPAFGLEGGRNWDLNGYLLGANLFFDSSKKAAHSMAVSGVPATVNSGGAAYGLGLKLGLPSDEWLPYAKLGYGKGKTNSGFEVGGNGAHAGAGIEYKLSSGLSLVSEMTTQFADGTGARFRNNNFSIGLTARPKLRP